MAEARPLRRPAAVPMRRLVARVRSVDSGTGATNGKARAVWTACLVGS